MHFMKGTHRKGPPDSATRDWTHTTSTLLHSSRSATIGDFLRCDQERSTILDIDRLDKMGLNSMTSKMINKDTVLRWRSIVSPKDTTSKYTYPVQELAGRLPKRPFGPQQRRLSVSLLTSSSCRSHLLANRRPKRKYLTGIGEPQPPPAIG